MRFLGRSLIGVLLVSLTLGLLTWGGQIVYSAIKAAEEEEQFQKPRRERTFTANVIEVVAGSHVPIFTAFGEIRSRRTLDIRATTGGSVVFMDEDFEEGGRVTEGQFLLRIDPADAEDALKRVEADIVEAIAEAREAEAALVLANEDLDAVRAQADLREAALNRQTDLRKRGVGTDTTVEIAALAVAAANQAIVSRKQAIAQAQARVDSASTALLRRGIEKTEAERGLAETEIYAAFSGTLSGVNLVEGGLVANNEEIAQLVDPSRLEVAFRVSTGQYVRLLDDNGQLIGADVRVSLDGLNLGLEASGKIIRESASVGEGQTGRVLFARLENTAGFRPGDFVTVHADEPALENVARIPSLAINANGEVLFVGDDSRLTSLKVEVIRRQGDDVLVRSDALYGRQIIAEQSPLLGGGIKINPILPNTGASVAPAAPEMVELSGERREKLIAFVESNKRMPPEAKDRLLGQLSEEQVPTTVVERLEGRMGG